MDRDECDDKNGKDRKQEHGHWTRTRPKGKDT